MTKRKKSPIAALPAEEYEAIKQRQIEAMRKSREARKAKQREERENDTS